MSFVLIAEPDEVNAARIRAILEGTDISFAYEMVKSAEEAIEAVEKQKPDVFIGDMHMPVMTGTELFSMIEMLSPQTARIVMTDGGNISETVAFINGCRIDKIIIKPCRVADDLLTPIERALSNKKARAYVAGGVHIIGEEKDPAIQHYEHTARIWKEKLELCRQRQSLLAEMLCCNLKGKGLSETAEKRLGRWYQWMAEEYMRGMFAGSGEYQSTVRMLTKFGHDPEHGCTFVMKRSFSAPVQPVRMNEMAYIIKLLTGVCRDLLNCYHIAVLLEQTEKFYILRICFQIERDENRNVTENVFRVRTPELRRLLIHATKLGVEAFGYKSTRLERGEQDILNIAVPR